MVRIKWKSGAFRQVRHAYAGYVAAKAREAAQDLPDGYEVVVQDDPSTQRPRAYLVARSMEARRDDAESNRLLKKISGLRGT